MTRTAQSSAIRAETASKPPKSESSRRVQYRLPLESDPKHKSLRIAVALLTVSLIGAACSSGDGDSATSDVGRPAAASEPADRSTDRRSSGDEQTGPRSQGASTTGAPATSQAPTTLSVSESLSESATDFSDRSAQTTTTGSIGRASGTATTEAAEQAADAPIEVGEFERTARDQTSTFALDVDTASYTIARRAIFDGQLPPATSVRVEEFVNAFKQDYQAPDRETFAIYADGAPHELVDDDTYVLRIGIAGREVSRRGRTDANLTFVVDVSGSMSDQGKMELVKDSLEILIDELDVDDRVAIVAYDDRAWVALEPTFVDQRNDILDAIDRLHPGGSTNVDAGLRLGYELARDTYDEGLVNLVILASDGVANTGSTNADDILDEIAEDAGRGIQMLAVGYGFGTYNDALLERLADAGNGVYAYIDDLNEAERLFADELTSTLVTVALDAKIQVEFESDAVRSWRLLGFENRALSDRDFDDEGVDAGEIGAGHVVTALYEIDLARGVRPGDDDVLGQVTLRWIDPESLESEELSGRIRATALDSTTRRAAPHLRWDIAVATTAELLRGSEWVGRVDTGELLDELEDIARELDTDEADEFVELVATAIRLGL